MMRHSRQRRVSPFLQMVEWMMLAVAVVCLEWYGLRMFDIHRRQAAARDAIERSLAEPRVAEPELPSTVPFGDLIGRLDIPRLKISAPVEAGEDASVLDYAVGHLPDTALPWKTGNSAFAAHRDRLFRPLEGIRIGDDIELATKYGNLHYKVSRTLIVNPKDLWVLKPTADADLTLITCFPFRYVGNAPKRFIVQARKIEPPDVVQPETPEP
jgi:LPXTG-site transpeptidase (sortase) family protein